jgi:hypothetical protein
VVVTDHEIAEVGVARQIHVAQLAALETVGVLAGVVGWFERSTTATRQKTPAAMPDQTLYAVSTECHCPDDDVCVAVMSPRSGQVLPGHYPGGDRTWQHA